MKKRIIVLVAALALLCLPTSTVQAVNEITPDILENRDWTIAGVWNFSTAPFGFSSADCSLESCNSGGTFGETCIDKATSIWICDGAGSFVEFVAGTPADDSITTAKLADGADTPVTGECLVVASAISDVEYITCPGGAEANNLEVVVGAVIDNEVFIGTGAGTGTYQTLPQCTSAQKLSFDGTTLSCVADAADVSSDGTSTDQMIARHDGTGGKTLGPDYSSGAPTVSDTGLVTVNNGLTVATGSFIRDEVLTKEVCAAGCEYTTITLALAGITDATTSKRYTILVHPGDYDEIFLMKSYITLRGMDKRTTRIRGGSATVNTITIGDSIQDVSIENLTVGGLVPIKFTSPNAARTRTYVSNCILGIFAAADMAAGAFRSNDGIHSGNSTLRDIYSWNNLYRSVFDSVRVGISDNYWGFSNLFQADDSNGIGLAAIWRAWSFEDSSSSIFESGFKVELDLPLQDMNIDVFDYTTLSGSSGSPNATLMNGSIEVDVSVGTTEAVCFKLGAVGTTTLSRMRIINVDCKIADAGSGHPLKAFDITLDADHANWDVLWSGGKVELTGGASRTDVANAETNGSFNFEIDGVVHGGTYTGAGTVSVADTQSGKFSKGITTDLELSTLTSIENLEVLIGTGAGTANYKPITGDVVISNAGLATIQALAVDAGDIAANAVGTNELDLSIAPTWTGPHIWDITFGSPDIITDTVQGTGLILRTTAGGPRSLYLEFQPFGSQGSAIFADDFGLKIASEFGASSRFLFDVNAAAGLRGFTVLDGKLRADRATAGVLPLLQIVNLNNPGAAGDGVEINMTTTDTAGSEFTTGTIQGIQTSAVIGSQEMDLAVELMNTGTLAEMLRLDGSAGGNLSFGRATAENRVLTFERGASDGTISYNGTAFDFNDDITLSAGALVDGRDLDNVVDLAGQLGGTVGTPDVRGLRTTTGPTLLTMGAVVDLQCLRRNGTTIDSATCGGGGDGVGYDEVMDEGTGRTKRAQVNFIGGGVSCIDNVGLTRTDCTITGAGGPAAAIQTSDTALTTRGDVRISATGAGLFYYDTAQIRVATGDGSGLVTDFSNASDLDAAGDVTIAAADISDQHANTNIAADLEEEGQINATVVTGDAIDHAVIVGTGAGTSGYTNALPNCTAGNVLTFTQAGNTWGCEADAGGAETNTLTSVLTGIIDDQFVIGGAGVATYDAVPDCDAAGSALTYDTTTNDVACTSSLQPLDTELTLVAGLAETTGNIMIGVAGAWASVAQPIVDCTNCTADLEAADNSTTQVSTTSFVQQEINGAGGTGLTCATGTCDVDLGTSIDSAEIEADVIVAADVAASLDTRKCFHLIVESIAVTDEWVVRLPPFTGTMTRFDCESYSGTSFTVDICDGEDIGDDTCTTSILGAPLVCGTAGANDTTLTNAGFVARDKLSLVITAQTGDPIGDFYMTCTVD